ncbi:MAG: hypothetical protein LUH07_12685 [Lachnospiraceae bacterium]|nr:hypothetical protein [Lachnospiraceae bacterium]
MAGIQEEPSIYDVIRYFENDYVSILYENVHKMRTISKCITATLQAQSLPTDDAERIEKASEQLLKEAELCENSLREIKERWKTGIYHF